MNESQVLQEFIDAKAILKGHFILSSGLHADTYMQCARVLMEADRAARLCHALAQKMESQLGKNIADIVVSPAMGGVVVGYEMGRQLNLPALFCERVEGNFTLRRGFEITNGTRILMVEDVVTTGKSSLEAMECVKSYGGNVVAEACLINRNKGHNPLPVPLIALAEVTIESYAPNALPLHLLQIPAIKPGSRGLK